jgi:hypothetical protein
MDNATTYPSITFQNTLSAFDLVVYDSFSTDDTTGNNENYFGTLTNVCSLKKGDTQTVQPVHGPVSAYIAFDTTGEPVGRYVTMGFDAASFVITEQDVAAMKNTFAFIDFILNNPNDAVATGFHTLISRDTLAPASVDDFFAKTQAYKNCTFQTYMLAITTRARTAASANKPIEQKTYSLSTLCNGLGGTWPAGFPDIEVSNFSCNTGDGYLLLKATVDLRDLPFESEAILKNVVGLLPDPVVKVQLYFNYKPGLALGYTRLSLLFNDIDINTVNGKTLKIHQPTISIDINPLFKFVVFTLKGSIPFNVFKKDFDADLSMTIDNVEAHVGVVIKGDHASLPSPPVMPGVHFDDFGAGMGIFFEPPGFAIGIQGDFHIGDGANNIALDDNKFAIVCRIEEEIPNPVYASFYVPKMDLNQVLEIFTNTKASIDFPVTFTNMSFKWAENPMEPITLPDGTLTDMSMGFSGAVDILSFGFYGDVEIGLDKGLTADIEMSPFSIKDVFQLSGDGKGVTIKVDQQGNPIKNNMVADTQALQQIIKNATDKQLVSAGGPVLRIRTFESPVLHLYGKVSLFDLVEYEILANIGKDGITFNLDYGALLSTKMSCTLDHFHNLQADFRFGVNKRISFPTIGGVSLGSIQLQALIQAHLDVSTTLSDVTIKAGGAFNFEGANLSFGDLPVDVHIKKITDLVTVMVNYIEQEAKTIFSHLLSDAQAWANKVKQGIISIANPVSDVLRIGWNKTAPEIASIMRNAGYAPSEIAVAIKNTFGLGVNEVMSAMRQAGYTAQEVASALRGVFNLKDISSAMQTVYSIDANAIRDVLQKAGYAVNDIGDAFRSLGGSFESVAKKAWEILNPFNW